MADEITIVECAPRDGMRLGKGDISLEEKASFIDELSLTGIKKIEAVSFVHPRLIPRIGDAEDVMKLIQKRSGTSYIGVTPSEVACRRAMLTNIDDILVLVAASEVFNQVALGYSLREMINKVLPSIINVALSKRKNIRTYILTSFGCPYEGNVPVRQVEELVSKLDFMKVSEISLVDSTGMATPVLVRELLSILCKMDLNAGLAVHFHDTRGMGMANAMAAFEAGIKIFDTAVGGMSTLPFGAPEQQVSKWNIPTEDLVNMFESMGIETGIDLDRLLCCVSMAEEMAGKQLSGHILRAGPTHRVFQPPQRLKLG
ncbi:MAG: hydroxymethylglutaryl-CoA lyase [Deltaproteobacteria bacterium]|nr:hydroxymethylglutaryl-CoA lyase [Deltaproteobacteria bacterium]